MEALEFGWQKQRDIRVTIRLNRRGSSRIVYSLYDRARGQVVSGRLPSTINIISKLY